MKKICITGANGFIGQSVYKTLLKEGRSCVGTVRSINSNSSNSNNKYIEVGNIGPNTNWKFALNGVDCAIHYSKFLMHALSAQKILIFINMVQLQISFTNIYILKNLSFIPIQVIMILSGNLKPALLFQQKIHYY